MSEVALPAGNARAFLLVRRGLPMLASFAALALSIFEPQGRGWYLLFSMACAVEVWPTFKGGEEYLRARPTIIRWDSYWTRALRPLARLLGVEKAWILSFCAWNNQRIREAFTLSKARRALVLLPHCIQMARCKAQILDDLQRCYSCGLCPVGDVLEAHLTSHWDTRISNRSHKAYRDAREFRPDLILAVSCADRLLKGLTRLNEIPSYAIPLSLPHGMCVDTNFDVTVLANAMERLVEPKLNRNANVLPLAHEDIA